MSNTPDELGLKLFAAWCGTTSEHAATRTLWETQGAQYTVDGWNRVSRAAREFCGDQRTLNSDLLAALEAARPLVEKWCHTQGNTEALFKQYLGPIDAALALANEPADPSPHEE